MRVKAAFVIGGAIGYVLGTRAGREQFEKIRSSARTVWSDPRVQGTVSGVEERASGFMRDVAPELKGKVSGAVRSAAGAIKPVKGEVDPFDDGPWDAAEPAADNDTPAGTSTGTVY